MEINSTPELPYIGLRPLTRQEASRLIGRNAEIRTLLARLAGTRFIAVTGAAGCGKSSLIQAGFIATLESGYLAEDGIAWGVLTMQPGRSPLHHLAQMLLDAGVEVDTADNQGETNIAPAERLAGQIASGGPLEFTRLIQRNLTSDYDWHVVLVIDQFEDLFRYESFANQEEVKFFVDLLLASARQDAVSIYVVIALESEWMEPCERFPGLVEAVAVGQVGAQLLSAEQWGVPQALTRDAEAVFSAFSPEQQQLAEKLFRCLSESRPRLPEQRRPATLQKIADEIGIAVTEVAAVIEMLRTPPHYFLLPEEGIALKPDTVIDIRSDLLLRHWPRLREWVAQEAESGRRYRHIESAALRWQYKQAKVLAAPDLDRSLEWYAREQPTHAWAARYGEHFDEALRFLLASCQTQQTRPQPIRRRSWQWGGLLILWIVAFIGLTGWSLWQQNITRQERVAAERARREAEIAQQRAQEARQQIEALKQPHTTELFEAYLSQAAFLAKSEDYAAAQAILTQSRNFDLEVSAERRHARNLLVWFTEVMGGTPEITYTGAGVRLFDVAVSPDGKLLAAVGEQGAIVVFDAEKGTLLKRLKDATAASAELPPVNQIAFHPTGKWLALAGNDMQITLFTVPDGDIVRKWHASGEVWALAVSPNGKLLASAGANAEITLWNPETKAQLRTLKGHQGAIHGLAFSPDGSLLVSGGYDRAARLWDVTTGKTLHALSGHTDKIFEVAFHPNSKLVATASADRTVRLWDTASGKCVAIFAGHTDMAAGLAFTEDGRQLISGSFDRTLRVWDVPPATRKTDTPINGVTVRVLQGHDGGVTRLMVRQDALFSSSNDGTVRRWNLRAAADRSRVVELPANLNTAAIAPDSKHLVVGFADGVLRLHRLPDLGLVWENSAAHTDVITALAFSADGARLISGSFDRQVKIWKVSDGTLEQTFKVHADGIEGVAFAPGGNVAASASVDGQIGWFDLTKQQARLHPVPKLPILHAVAFDASGQRLISASDDGKARLWNVNVWPFKLLREIPASSEPVFSATFSPDGQRLAVAGRDQRMHLFDLKDGREIRQLVGHDDTIFRVAFSPDGGQIVTVSQDATLRAWDLTTGNPLFSLPLPTNSGSLKPLWTADVRCTVADCWIAVPMARGRLALYRLDSVYE